MSPVWLVLLASVLAARAQRARFGDYAASMPLYSLEEGRDALPPSDDYLERSPDAPLPADYKYEEEFRDKENKQIDVQEESWHIAHDEFREPPQHPQDEDLHKHEEESEPKLKTRRKNRRQRARIKSKEIIDSQEQNYRLKAASKVRSGRIDKNPVDDNYDYTRKARMREDNGIESNDAIRATTEKVIRRKPRDRRINLRRQNVDDVDEDDGDLKSFERGDMKHLRKEDINPFERDDEPHYVEDRRPNSRRFMVQRPKTKMKHKDYPEYDDDYYDMKRVKEMKHKMPDLLRRTQASTTESPRSRAVHPLPFGRAETSAETRSSTAAAAKHTPTRAPPTEEIASRTTSVAVIPLIGATARVEASDVAQNNATNSTDMSLAEKSRLSILRKAQRKDAVRNVTRSTKPPVLMQVTVTGRMQTLVMVEPAQEARLRAREVSEDSPERIERAKRLMRQKLVARAQNIHQLTDNWDDLVCDYIDVSLLDGAAVSRPALIQPFLILAPINLYWFLIFI